MRIPLRAIPGIAFGFVCNVVVALTWHTLSEAYWDAKNDALRKRAARDEDETELQIQESERPHDTERAA